VQHGTAYGYKACRDGDDGRACRKCRDGHAARISRQRKARQQASIYQGIAQGTARAGQAAPPAAAAAAAVTPNPVIPAGLVGNRASAQVRQRLAGKPSFPTGLVGNPVRAAAVPPAQVRPVANKIRRGIGAGERTGNRPGNTAQNLGKNREPKVCSSCGGIKIANIPPSGWLGSICYCR
jgi:hypothetical protein